MSNIFGVKIHNSPGGNQKLKHIKLNFMSINWRTSLRNYFDLHFKRWTVFLRLLYIKLVSTTKYIDKYIVVSCTLLLFIKEIRRLVLSRFSDLCGNHSSYQLKEKFDYASLRKSKSNAFTIIAEKQVEVIIKLKLTPELIWCKSISTT